MMERPTRPPAPDSQAEKRGSLLPILMAVGLALAAATALMFLTLGLFAYVIVAGLILFFVAGFHYLVWGRWLERVIRAQVDEEDRLERERAAKSTEQPGQRSNDAANR